MIKKITGKANRCFGIKTKFSHSPLVFFTIFFVVHVYQRGGRNVEFKNVENEQLITITKVVFNFSLLQKSERQKEYRKSDNQTFDVLILPMEMRMIRTSKIKHINYLWRITYGYQACGGLGQGQLGQVRLGQAGLGQVRFHYVNLGQIRLR